MLGPDLAYLTLEVESDGSVAGSLVFKNGTAGRFNLSGSVAPGGTLTLSTSNFPSSFNCRADLVLYAVPYANRTEYGYTALFGNCGDRGMLVGTFRPRTVLTPVVAPGLATVGEPVRMSSAFPAGNPTATYEWQFGDGGIAQGSSAQTHVYSSPGTYVIRLIEEAVSGAYRATYEESLTVVCADGTLCNDFEEPVPWATLDSVGCELRDIPPSAYRRFGTQYTKGPVITFSGRAKVSSNDRLFPIASRHRLATEADFLSAFRFVFSIEPLGQQYLEASCTGRMPCTSGPITAFTDSPLTRADALQYMFEQASPPFWLYVAVFDATNSRLYSLVEKQVNCPAFVPSPRAAPLRTPRSCQQHRVREPRARHLRQCAPPASAATAPRSGLASQTSAIIATNSTDDR